MVLNLILDGNYILTGCLGLEVASLPRQRYGYHPQHQRIQVKINMRNKPRKPTKPYRHIAFSKNGKVRKKMFQLSHDKEEQEEGVIEHFLNNLPTKSNEFNIMDYKQLPEADQDFVIHTEKGKIYVQVTEIVEREYTFPISKEEYNSGTYSNFILQTSGEIPWAVDISLRDTSISRAIERKINKHYAKSEHETLWLLIFCTSTYLKTEYWESGEKKKSRALFLAHEYLNGTKKNIFDQIWFTNLQTSPVKIWPVENKRLIL